MKAKNFYKQFINDRDLALERILHNTRMEIADITRHALLDIAQQYLSGSRHASLQNTIIQASVNIARVVKSMRNSTWILATSSEAEVLKRIGASTKDTLHVFRTPPEILHDQLEAGGSIEARVHHYLNKIVRKIENLKSLKELKGQRLTPDDIRSCLPKPKIIKAPRTALSKLKEAESNEAPKKPMVVDFISESDWDDILDDYNSDYIPTSRGPDTIFGDKDLEKQGIEPSSRYEDVTYGWEVEQDVTHDFVQTVRLGQSDAANAMGVTDLVWISILDSRTDECCAWRDGLLTSEIETELNKGHHDDEDCDDTSDGIAPPIHFNCRCTLAPATEDLPDVPPSNQIDFKEWLNS